MVDKTPPPQAFEPLGEPSGKIGGEKKTGKNWKGKIASFLTEKWKKASSYVEQKVSTAKSHIFHKEQQASKTVSIEKPKGPSPQVARVQRLGVRVFPTEPSSRKGVEQEVRKRPFSSEKPPSHLQLLSDFSHKKIHNFQEIRELDALLKKELPNPLDDSKKWDELIRSHSSLASVLTSIRNSAIKQKIVDDYGEWRGLLTVVKYASAKDASVAQQAEQDKLSLLRKNVAKARSVLQSIQDDSEKKSFDSFLSKIEEAIPKL